MAATTTITGSANATVGAQCTGPDAGTKADAADVNGALQSIENDIATLKRQLRRARATLADANGTMSKATAWRYNLNGSPAAPRVITVTKAAGSPEVGDIMTAFFLSVIEGSNTLAYTFKRDDASTIATIVSTSDSSDLRMYWVSFEYVGGSVNDWRLAENSGAVWDTAAAALSGVLPGSSA